VQALVYVGTPYIKEKLSLAHEIMQLPLKRPGCGHLSYMFIVATRRTGDNEIKTSEVAKLLSY